MKKISLLSILAILLANTAFAGTQAASLNATGYEWLGYSAEDKNAFAHLLYVIHGVDKNERTAGEIVKTLDDFYYGAINEAKSDPLRVDEDEFLKIRCVDVITKNLSEKHKP